MDAPRDPRDDGAPEGAGPSLSIGDLARATGVSEVTLRAWERRYGRPAPQRLPSGHRRYASDQVCFVRQVAEGLSRGLKLADLMRAGPAQLERLLAGADPCAEGWEPRHLLELAAQWRAAEIAAALRDSHARLGSRAFVELRLAPLLRCVGSGWAAGRVAVRHEHFLSSVVEDLLRALRDGQPVPDGAPVVVLATLEQERHALGLHMAALVCAARRVRPLLLGACAPPRDVAAAAQESGAAGVAVGVSAATCGPPTDRVLAELRRQLPARVRLVVGGAQARGVRRGPRGVEWLGDGGMSAFESWLDGLA
jgi:DNA-binding transcriptional MerR regulator